MDVRLPVGVSAAMIEARVAATSGATDGISWRILRRTEPSFTPPDSEIVKTVVDAATQVLGKAPAINMRVGGSDSRLFRRAGIATIVYGSMPFNMGGADEYALLEESQAAAAVQALAAVTFLAGNRPEERPRTCILTFRAVWQLSASAKHRDDT